MSTAEETLSKIESFWERKQVVVKCPICGHDDFFVTRDAELYTPLTASIASESLTNPKLEMSSYAVHCGHCGFVMNFKRSVFEDERGEDAGPELTS